MGKQTIGRWVLGIGSALGLSREILTEPPAKEPTVIESTEHPVETIPTEENSVTQDAPHAEPPVQRVPDQNRNTNKVHEMLNELPNDLPSLKNIPEIAPAKNGEFNLNPFLGFEQAKGFVTRIIDNVAKPCVDKITHLLPDFLPQGTIGMTVVDLSTPTEQIYRVQLEQVITNEEQEKSWQQFCDFYFRPETESMELVADPSLQDIIPTVTVTGVGPHQQEAIRQFQETIALVRIYLQAGMERQIIIQLIEQKKEKNKKTEKPTKKALSH